MDFGEKLKALRTERGLDADRVEASAREAYDALGALDIAVKRGSARPPKSSKA